MNDRRLETHSATNTANLVGHLKRNSDVKNGLCTKTSNTTEALQKFIWGIQKYIFFLEAGTVVRKNWIFFLRAMGRSS